VAVVNDNVTEPNETVVLRRWVQGQRDALRRRRHTLTILEPAPPARFELHGSGYNVRGGAIASTSS